MKILLGQAYSFHQQGFRDYQEDSRWPDCDQPSPNQRFYLVCDGVGGSEKGELASQTVCKTFGKMLETFDFDKDFSNSDFSRILDVAYDSLDKVADSTSFDMGTTMTFAAFHGEGCTLAHIGDSRIYQIRPSVGMLYRSDDHSLVNQMVHSGIITPEEAEHHPQKHVITRCMSPVVEDQSRCIATVMRTKDIQNGDYFLLCSDGVLDKMTDGQIVQLLSSEKADSQKIQEMADLCKDSTDNNTAFLIHIDKVERKNECKFENLSPKDTVKIQAQTQSIEEIESVQHSHSSIVKVLKKQIKQLFKY